MIPTNGDTVAAWKFRSRQVGLALGLATFAVAATKGEFGNMCTMGLALHKNISTDCSVNTVYRGKTYCFGNEQAKAQFLKHPHANLAKAEAFYSKERHG
jgi:YHS domain-containing protein